MTVLVGIARSVLVALASAPLRAQTSGKNATHDPSRIIESYGKF